MHLVLWFIVSCTSQKNVCNLCVTLKSDNVWIISGFAEGHQNQTQNCL